MCLDWFGTLTRWRRNSRIISWIGKILHVSWFIWFLNFTLVSGNYLLVSQFLLIWTKVSKTFDMVHHYTVLCWSKIQHRKYRVYDRTPKDICITGWRTLQILSQSFLLQGIILEWFWCMLPINSFVFSKLLVPFLWLNFFSILSMNILLSQISWHLSKVIFGDQHEIELRWKWGFNKHDEDWLFINFVVKCLAIHLTFNSEERRSKLHAVTARS